MRQLQRERAMELERTILQKQSAIEYKKQLENEQRMLKQWEKKGMDEARNDRVHNINEFMYVTKKQEINRRI